MEILQQLFGVAFLSAAVRLATPLLLTAFGEVIAERAGVINIGIEGIMLVGAFFGSAVAVWTGNLWFGVLAAATAGLIVALIFGFFCITLMTDQIVTGLVMNILAVGATSLMLRVFFPGQSWDTKTPGFALISIPLLKDIPVLGPTLFQEQEPLTYVALLLVPIFWYVLYRSGLGLSLRAVGEHARAADTLGIDVSRLRYVGTLIGGVMAGLGGAFVSLGVVGLFQDNMIQGRGYIALAVVIFGKWDPIKVLLASLIFGGAQALEFRIPITSLRIPTQVPAMIPYILTLIALVGIVGRTQVPAELAKPYDRDEG